MNAKDFINAWKFGHSFVNDRIRGDITNYSGDRWQLHINAEIIVFFDSVKETVNRDVVLLMDGDHATPMCTFSWRVAE